MSAAVQGHPQVKDEWSHDQPCNCEECQRKMEGEDKVVSATRRRTGRSVRPIPSPVVEFTRPESMFGEFTIECGDPEKSVWLMHDREWVEAMMGMMGPEKAEELWQSLPPGPLRFKKRGKNKQTNVPAEACYPYFKLKDGRLLFISGGWKVWSEGCPANTTRCTSFTLITDPTGTQERECKGQGYRPEGKKELRFWGPYPSN
jgi:hypothetical protein